MAYESAVDPDYMRRMREFMRQRELTTGLPTRPEDIQALTEAQLNVSSENRRRDLSIAEQKRQFDIQAQQQADAAKKAERSASISGATQLVSTGAQLAMVGKQAGWWGAGSAGAAGTATGTGMGTAAGGGVGAGLGAFPAGSAGAGMAAGQSALSTQSAITGLTSGTGTGLSGGGAAAAGSAGSGAGGAGAGLTAGTAATAAGAGGVAGAVGSHLAATYSPIGGEKEKNIGGGIVSGAAAGWYASGYNPWGAVIGGAAGLVSGLIHKGTIICTELHAQGFIPEETRRWAAVFGGICGRDAYLGYVHWATPVVAMMRKSRRFARVVNAVLGLTIEQMAHNAVAANFTDGTPNPYRSTLYGRTTLTALIWWSKRTFRKELSSTYVGAPSNG